MNIYEAFESDLVDEAKTFPLSEDASITLMPTSGDKAKRAFERLMEPYSVRLNAGGKLSEEENKKLNVRFFAEFVIKGWEGIKDAEGKDIEFSVDAAKELLSDPKLEKFFLLVIKMASNEESYKQEREESDAGN